MSALFDFQSFLTVVLLFICSCTYYKLINPSGLTQTTGYVLGTVGKQAAGSHLHACVAAQLSVLLDAMQVPGVVLESS
jgi:hypothetical protein